MTAVPETETLHATTVAIGGRGVLIEGATGAGKSDLALRLIDRGATLVADDRTIVARKGKRVIATAPATIAGRMEVRGIGIVGFELVDRVDLALVVTLSQEVERMPEAAYRDIAGIALPAIRLDPRESSAPIKCEIALRERAAQ